MGGGLHGGEGGEASLFKVCQQNFLLLGRNRFLGEAERSAVDAEGLHGDAQGGGDAVVDHDFGEAVGLLLEGQSLAKSPDLQEACILL